MAEHNTLTGSSLHEPKGADIALDGQVYIADGAGSGSFDYLPIESYADLYITGGVTAQTLLAASAFAKLNPTGGWSDGEKNQLTTIPANGEITLDEAGTYQVSFWTSFDTAAITTNVQYYFKYALDGVVNTRIVSVQKNTGNVDHLNVAATGIVTATAGQVLSIYVGGDATSSGTNITVTDAGLSVHLIKRA